VRPCRSRVAAARLTPEKERNMPVTPLAMDPSNTAWAYDDYLWSHAEPIGEEPVWPGLAAFLTNPRAWIAEWGGSAPPTMITLTTRYTQTDSVTTAGKSASNVAIMEGRPLPYAAPTPPDREPIPGSVDEEGNPLDDWRITYTLRLAEHKCYIHFPVRLQEPANLEYVARIISQPAAIISQVNATPDSQKVVREVGEDGVIHDSAYTVTVLGFRSGSSAPTIRWNADYARGIRWVAQSACVPPPRGESGQAVASPTESICSPACCTLVTETTPIPEGSNQVKVKIGDAWYLCYLASPGS
jgi:hypothetical protein